MRRVSMEFTLEDGLVIVGSDGSTLARTERYAGGYRAVTPGGRIVATAATIVGCAVTARSRFSVSPC